jgi:hypothetical protein
VITTSIGDRAKVAPAGGSDLVNKACASALAAVNVTAARVNMPTTRLSPGLILVGRAAT